MQQTLGIVSCFINGQGSFSMGLCWDYRLYHLNYCQILSTPGVLDFRSSVSATSRQHLGLYGYCDGIPDRKTDVLLRGSREQWSEGIKLQLQSLIMVKIFRYKDVLHQLVFLGLGLQSRLNLPSSLLGIWTQNEHRFQSVSVSGNAPLNFACLDLFPYLPWVE